MTTYLSPSTLTKLSSCGMAVYNEKVLKWPTRTGVPALMGNTTHRAYLRDLQAKAAEAPLQRSDVRDLASTCFDFEWQKAIDTEALELSQDERLAGKEKTRGWAKDKSIGMSMKAHNVFTPLVALESKNDVEVPVSIRSGNVVVRGRLDSLERTAARIGDLKTKPGRPDTTELSGSVALSFYTFALQKSGVPIKRVSLDVITREKVEKAWRIESDAPTEFRPLFRQIDAATKAFETGSFYPADQTGPTGWVCSENYCPHFERCPYGRARRSTFTNVALDEVGA